MPANIHHGEIEDAEPVILAVVAAKTGIRNAVAMVTAALLPVAMFRLPVMCTITPPSGLLYLHLGRASLLRRPIGLLLTLLLLLLSSGLLLLSLLALLTLLAPGLLLLTLLLLLLASGLLLLALLTLLAPGLLLLTLPRSLSLLLLMLLLLFWGLRVLMRLRLSLFLVLRGPSLFVLFFLPRVS